MDLNFELPSSISNVLDYLFDRKDPVLSSAFETTDQQPNFCWDQTPTISGDFDFEKVFINNIRIFLKSIQIARISKIVACFGWHNTYSQIYMFREEIETSDPCF